MRIKDEDKKYLLTIKPEQITKTLCSSLFEDTCTVKDGKTIIVKSKFQAYDTFELKKGEYFNKEDVVTTIGSFIYNKIIIERDFVEVLGYHNKTINKGELGDIEEKLAAAILEDKIEVAQYLTYLDRTQWVGSNLTHMLCGSFTMGVLNPNKEVIKERDDLIKKNRKKIDEGDITTSVLIEQQLIKKAKKSLEKDPGMDLFNSGARGSFENNYKNQSIMKGPTFNPIENKFELIDTNFMEGIKKEHMHLQGNSIIAGAYPKAIATADSGYLLKQLVATFQTVVLDKKGSNCGSKGYVEYTITEKSVEKIIYRYILDGDKTIILTPENIKKYIGKTVKMRSPMFCTTDKLCNHCGGDIFYKLGIENVGIVSAQMASDTLNLAMKKFHDATAKIYEINIDELFL